jgi:hypothetical protein
MIMRFGKRALFLVLNGAILVAMLCYFSIWLLGNTTRGFIQRPYLPNTVTVAYSVNGKSYTGQHMRNGLPFSKKEVSLRYLSWHPAASRINSFMGLAAEPLAWWAVFFMAAAMLLLTNNTVFSKGTQFQLHKGFPWLTMDEYFPAAGPQWTESPHRTKAQPPHTGRLNDAEHHS